MRALILVGLLCSVLAGCAGLGAQVVHPTSAFDMDEANKMMRKGHAIIEGSALVRQNGGGVVTCAGVEVSAIPATRYAQERMYIIYGNDEKGFRPLSAAFGQKVPPPAPATYLTAQRSAVCDAQGFFQFNDLAAGTYYIVTQIVWRVGASSQGGALLQKVTVSEMDIRRIVLSP